MDLISFGCGALTVIVIEILIALLIIRSEKKFDNYLENKKNQS